MSHIVKQCTYIQVKYDGMKVLRYFTITNIEVLNVQIGFSCLSRSVYSLLQSLKRPTEKVIPPWTNVTLPWILPCLDILKFSKTYERPQA